MYKLASGSIFYAIRFDGANRQFDQLEISLVFDKSDQHVVIFDSHNAESALTNLGKEKVENITNTHSVANDLEFDFIH